MIKYEYTDTLPNGMYDWTFSHTGPKNLKIVYVSSTKPKPQIVAYLPKQNKKK